MRLRLWLVLTALVMLPSSMLGADRAVIDDFADVSAWSVNQYGGSIAISSDAGQGIPAMRLAFAHAPHEWGNAARRIDLPPNAAGIEFDMLVDNAGPQAALSLWLFEPDGDGHPAHRIPDGKLLAEMKGGWRHCFVPISAFRFDPRGNKRNELLTANKLLIGINNHSADVRIANLAFRLARRDAKMNESRTPNLTPENGPRGRVAILQGDFPARPGNADPEVLKEEIRRYGFGVTALRSGDLADPSMLNTASFDCLVLPYGPSYPAAAADAIKGYLKSGGSFLSMGGYAFDEACVLDESGRLVALDAAVTAEDIASGKAGPTRLNTRFGKPGDTMGLEPDQIGVFDPAYHLLYASSLQPAPSQHVIPKSVRGRPKLEGYAACSLLGSNSPVFPAKWGRHIPLAEAYDSFGRQRGPVGSMALNYAGPYAGSAWAFFGVTNVDLFARGGPMLPHVGRIVEALTRKVFLHSLATDLAYYRDGEPVKITCSVADLGKSACEARVRFTVLDRVGKRVLSSEPIAVSLQPGETRTAETTFSQARFASDLYRVVAELTVGRTVIDSMETGFAAYQPKLTASGLDLRYRDNYFHVGDRPVLLSGTNATGAIFYSGNENPLVWDRDLARMSENGLNILRVLHFSPFMSDKPSPGAVKAADLALERMPLKIERQLDAMVQLCQKHNIVLFLSIHDWMPVELSDEELAAQRRFAKLIAERYKDVPGFMIDIQNEPHIELPKQEKPNENPDVVKAWNQYLRQKYGSDDRLKDAWKQSPPERPLGSVPYRAGTDAWGDMRTFDADYFRNVLLNRWAEANYRGAKEGDPNVPVTVGFLQEYWSLNKLMCVDGLDFANMHSYSSIDVLRADLKLFDRRFQGKSLSLGEFGALPDHEKRVHGQDNPGQDIDRYLRTGHYAFGLGASFIASWCWKDMDDVVFPWGMNYTCGGPRKDLLKAYRNQSLLFRQVRPVYEPPSTFLVVPVEAMLGGQAGNTIRMLYRHVDALLDAHVHFGTIDDQHLKQLPASAKVLVYPVPMHVPDEAYTLLRSFAERGGTLLIAGDISYDEFRQRTKTDRLKELCGVQFVSENCPNVSWGDGDRPCISTEITAARANGECFVSRLGQGQVWFTATPSAGAGKPSGYAFADALAQHDKTRPTSGSSHVLAITEPQAESLALVNARADGEALKLSHPGRVPVEVTLANDGVGLVRYRGGAPCLIESQRTVVIGGGGTSTIPMKGHFALVALDGKSIETSREMIVLPSGEGEIDLTGLSSLRDAVVQTGDVIDGKWVVLSESTDRKIRCTADTAFDIRIVAPKHRLSALGRMVASELMLR